MKLSEPIGNAHYAPFFIRLASGAFFVLSGRSKLNGMPGIVQHEFVTQIKNLHAMPDQLATVYAILLPYVEMFVGGMILVGMWTTLIAGLGALLLASWVYLFGIYSSEVPKLLNKDVITFAGVISLMYSGPGMLSIDKFRKSG